MKPKRKPGERRASDLQRPGYILYLFCSDTNFVAASNDREALRQLGDTRCSHGGFSGYSIMPLDFVIETAYFI